MSLQLIICSITTGLLFICQLYFVGKTTEPGKEHWGYQIEYENKIKNKDVYTKFICSSALSLAQTNQVCVFPIQSEVGKF